MKIIAESEEEKQEILKVSRYLHDFRVYKSKYLGKISVLSEPRDPSVNMKEIFFELKGGQLAFLDLESEVGNYFRHIYLNPELIEVTEVKNDS